MCTEFEYQELLSSIANQITADELETMRFLCREFILYPESRETQSDSFLREVFGFFNKLETRNKLGIDDLELLKKMLRHLKKNDLLLRVTGFQFQRQSYLSTLSPDEREIESGNNQTTGSQRGESQAVANQTSRGAIVMQCAPYLAGAAWAVGSAYILNHHKDDPKALKNLVAEVLLPTGIFIKSIFAGSINFLLQATDLNSLKELWKRYQSGRLKEDLQKVLVTEELKNLANGEPIDLVVTLSEKEYRNACLDLMVAQTKVHTLCQETTSPKLVRRISRSLPDLTSLDTTQDISSALLSAQLSDHLKKLKQKVKKTEKTENDSSQSQQLKAKSREFEEYFEDKATMDEEENEDTLTSGELQQVKRYLKRALSILEKGENENYRRLASTLNDLGACLIEQGQYEKAKEYYERALLIREEEGNRETDPHFATILNNLGFCLNELGQYAKAQEYLKRALSIREKGCDENDPQLATTLNNIGFCLRQQGQYEKAQAYLERALSIRELGENASDPQLANTLDHLGLCLNEQGQYEKAQTCFKRALSIREMGANENDPMLVDTLSNLGICFSEQGQYEKAQVYLERALSIREKGGDENDPMLADLLNNLGWCLNAQGQYEKAQEYYKRALSIS